MSWSEWEKFSGTIEFDMYCFSYGSNDYGNSRFSATLDNAKITITPVHFVQNYLKDELTPSIWYDACGIYYRTDESSNYVRVKEEITLISANYIDILVLGYGSTNSSYYGKAHIKIE